jgi:hypothetical protein
MQGRASVTVIVLATGLATGCADRTDRGNTTPAGGSRADDASVGTSSPDAGRLDAAVDAEPPHLGIPSSRQSCRCTCSEGETCFTQLACALHPDGGGGTCGYLEGHGDDRCHRMCKSSVDCSPDEFCFHVQFYGCSDYNGAPNGRGICCNPTEGCK